MSDQHSAALERTFSQQAAAFEDRRFNKVFTDDVAWLFERLSLAPEQLALDVAAGTGHAARALAPFVRGVVALDATPAMLAVGKRAADRIGLRNVLFQRGDASALPYLEDSFDVVVSRFAVHHFERPSEQAMEMARCLRPGGQLVIADLLSDDVAAIAATQNRLERLRDLSHTKMLTLDELTGLVERMGLTVRDVQTRDIDRPLAPWLAQTEAGEDVITSVERELRAELAGGAATGFDPREDEADLHFVQRFAAVTASKPTRPNGAHPSE
jgi:ubiquinone/menaquinone biosynthesis C-methylase UbiE